MQIILLTLSATTSQHTKHPTTTTPNAHTCRSRPAGLLPGCLDDPARLPHHAGPPRLRHQPGPHGPRETVNLHLVFHLRHLLLLLPLLLLPLLLLPLPGRGGPAPPMHLLLPRSPVPLRHASHRLRVLPHLLQLNQLPTHTQVGYDLTQHHSVLWDGFSL